jgi:WD40 repeat protein
MYKLLAQSLLSFWFALLVLQPGQRHKSLAQGKNGKPETAQGQVDLYGDSLPENAIARLGTVRLRVPSYNESLAFTPDGKRILSTGWGAACLWDPTTGRLLRHFGTAVDNRPVGPISVTRDGKLLAVGGQLGQVFEVETGRQVYTFGRKGDLLRPAFSPGGRFLAAIHSSDFTLELYNGLTGKMERSFPVGEENQRTGYPRILGPVFTPDNKRLITVVEGRQIRFWNPFSGIEQRPIIANTDEVTNISLSPDGSLLASAGLNKVRDKDGTIRGFMDDRVSLWQVATGKMLRQILVGGNKNWAYAVGRASLTFGPDGKTLWTSAEDGTLHVWDVASGKEARQFSDHSGCQAAIAFAPDGKTFAVADVGMAIRVRDVTTGRDLAPTSGQRSAIVALAVSPDGRQVASGSGDRTTYLWELSTGRELRRLGDKDDVSNLVYSLDGRVLFSAAYQILRAWDLKTPKDLWRFEAKEGIGSVLTLSPDGKMLASAGRGRTILVIDATTGKEIGQLGASGWTIDAVAFSSDAQTLAACSDHENFDRWEIATGKLIQHFTFADYTAQSGTLSPDGRLLAVSGFDDTIRGFSIRVIDISSRREICRFPKRRVYPPVSPISMVFSPDGKTLAWSGQTDSLNLVEVRTGQERCQFAGHRETIYSMAFSPDGKFLVSGSGDTTALVWDLTGRLAAEKNGSGPLTQSKLASCWEDLRGEDGARAYTAIQRLKADPPRSVPYLGKQLQPAAGTDAARLARLIGDLDSNQFAVRQQATEELEKLEELAQPALEKALAAKPSAEVKRRVEPLLEKIRAPVTSGPKLQILRAIEVLEHIGTPEAQEVLQTLAKGAPEALITREAKASLDRLRKLAAHTP